MTTELWVAIVSQTVIVVLAVIAGIRHSEKRVSKLETKVEHLEDVVKPIAGISRSLARLEGQILAHRKTSGH